MTKQRAMTAAMNMEDPAIFIESNICGKYIELAKLKISLKNM